MQRHKKNYSHLLKYCKQKGIITILTEDTAFMRKIKNQVTCFIWINYCFPGINKQCTISININLKKMKFLNNFIIFILVIYNAAGIINSLLYDKTSSLRMPH